MAFELKKLSDEELSALRKQLENLSNQKLLTLYERSVKDLERCEEQMNAAFSCVAVSGYPEDHARLLNELPIIKEEVEKRMKTR